MKMIINANYLTRWQETLDAYSTSIYHYFLYFIQALQQLLNSSINCDLIFEQMI